ncbi:cytochrome c [Paracoccus sediminis]|jgi:cytochrome c553|uniref:Cytochrome c n=1 Tax=Paracoccus sediminis TaxID=1214787 RepID=A0A238YET9_9RHOB|nr:cytochrome c [Paracoccus sediminis]TBN46808.1 cytochrome c [Paracoccus sediminis]SNR68879.1 Cytochrome c553 [Paracoccus sediminis]
MTSFHGLAFAAAFGLCAAAAHAQDAGTPPPATQTCRVCHGVDGAGTNPMIPNIGGQSVEYLSKQLQDFRAGRREDPQMSIIARDLSDDDIKALAAWYGSITATYTLPE